MRTLVAVIATLAWANIVFGGDYVVVNKTESKQRFTVVNKIEIPKQKYNGDWPPYTAPTGKGWKRYVGESWELYDLPNAVSEVAVSRPFLQRNTIRTTDATNVGISRQQVQGLGSYVDTTQTGRTLIGVKSVGTYGGTDCPTSG